MTHKEQYRDQDAQDNQEVVTPKELVDHIYSFLDKEDFEGKDILDPCVGPGALIEPILANREEWQPKSLTVMDIQACHIDAIKEEFKGKELRMQLLTATDDFLTKDFGLQRFDLIIQNPPFSKFGIKFIEKAVSLLKPGGKIICIMATDMFSPMPLNEIGQPGTFSWLNQRGSFERIEMYRAITSADIPKERITFHDITSTCWFVWEKGKEEKETTITNSYNETFTYFLTGEETKIPMEPWNKIKNYVNWDSENSLYFTQSKPDNKTVVSFRISLKNGVKIKEKSEDGLWASLNVNEPGYKLDKKKFIDFIGKDRATRSRTRVLYSKKVVTAINHYPLDKEYFRLKE